MDTIERGRFPRLGCAVGALCCTVLVACGGGGEVDPPKESVAAAPDPISSPYGVFGGTLTGHGPQDIVMFIGVGGTLFAVYGTDAANDFKVAGMLTAWRAVGSTTTRYRGGGVVDWSAAAASMQLDISFDPAVPAMSGAVNSAMGSRTIAGGALLANGYQFATPASLDVVRGHWELATSQGRQLSIDIGADGVVTGTSGQCTLYDSYIKPDASGSNVFELQMRFAGGGRTGCGTEPHASDGMLGVALAYAPIGGGLQLVIGASDFWDPVYLAAAGKR